MKTKKVKNSLFQLIIAVLTITVVAGFYGLDSLLTTGGLSDFMLLITDNMFIIASACIFASFLWFTPVCLIVGSLIFPFSKRGVDHPEGRQVVHSPNRSLGEMYFEQRGRYHKLFSN